jgi:hypothetical protein
VQEDYQALMQSAEAAGVTYDVTLFGDTVHAFTEPSLPLLQHEPGASAAYSPYADQRSWASAMDWLEGLFGEEMAVESVSGFETYDLKYDDPSDDEACVSIVTIDTSGTRTESSQSLDLMQGTQQKERS